MAFCQQCGADNRQEARFCVQCGATLTAPSPAVAAHDPYAASPATVTAARNASKTSTLAIISLIAGIVQVLCCFVGGLVAVICGHLARSEIRKSEGSIDGDGLALAGLILGYIGIAFSVIYFVGVFALAFFAGLK